MCEKGWVCRDILYVLSSVHLAGEGRVEWHLFHFVFSLITVLMPNFMFAN